MSTVVGPNSQTLLIRAGEQLSIDLPSSAAGYVVQLPVSAGAANGPTSQLTAGRISNFGPFNFDCPFRIVCSSGSLSYSFNTNASVLPVPNWSSPVLAPGLKNFGRIATKGHGQQLQSVPNSDGTWHFALESEVPWVAVRACIRNILSTSYTIDNIAFAPSNSISNVTPSGAWVQGSFAGATSLLVPARLGVDRVSHSYSDWTAATSIVGSNGFGFHAAHVRAYIATGPFSGSGGSTTLTQWAESAANPLMRNRYVLCAAATGNFVSSNQANFASNFSYVDLTPILELDFLTTDQCVTVCSLGDSIRWGGGGLYDMVGSDHLSVCAVSTPTKPVFWQNASVPSTTTTQFVQRFVDMLAAGSRPQILIYQAFSRNDGTPTPSTIAQCRYNLYTILRLCAQYDIIPIIDTGTAETTAAWDATADNLRKDWANVIRDLKSHDVLVSDSDSMLSNGATPARYRTSLTIDNTHPNDPGQLAVSTYQVTPALQSALTKCFA